MIPQLLVRTTPLTLSSSQSNRYVKNLNATPPYVFQVALGEAFTQSVPWGLVKNDLLKHLPLHYEYKLFNEAASQSFLQSYFPEHLTLFYNLHHIAHRADLVRYLLLYKFGGFYLDVDLKLKMSLEEILQYTKTAEVWFLGYAPNECLNGFIIAPVAGNVLFLHLVEEMYKDHARPGHPDYLFNVKRLFTALSQLYPGLGSYSTINGVYFGKETLDNQNEVDNGDSPKYSLNLNTHTVALAANGHFLNSGEEKKV